MLAVAFAVPLLPPATHRTPTRASRAYACSHRQHAQRHSLASARSFFTFDVEVHRPRARTPARAPGGFALGLSVAAAAEPSEDAWPFSAPATESDDIDVKSKKTIFDFAPLLNVDGEDISGELHNKVVLCVNWASKSPDTASKAKMLQDIFARYKGEGLEILAFPCADFGSQEYASAEQTRAAFESHGCTFRLMERAVVNGKEALPLYRFLKHKLQVGQNRVVNNVKWCAAARGRCGVR
eukprot:tig00001339_g8259.t1